MSQFPDFNQNKQNLNNSAHTKLGTYLAETVKDVIEKDEH